MKRQGQASNSSGLGRIAPLPDSNPTRGRLLCNRKKTMGRNVNLGLTEPFNKRAFARTVCTDKGTELRLMHLEGNVMQNAPFPVAL